MIPSALLALAFAALVSSARLPAHTLRFDGTSWKAATGPTPAPAMSTATFDGSLTIELVNKQQQHWSTGEYPQSETDGSSRATHVASTHKSHSLPSSSSDRNAPSMPTRHHAISTVSPHLLQWALTVTLRQILRRKLLRLFPRLPRLQRDL